jgi:hypothetical protein
MSPSTISEEGRRDLIARQHRALYGNEGATPAPGFGADDTGRDQAGNMKTPIGAGPRGPSPRAADPFGAPGLQDDKQTSPSGPQSSGFGGFESVAQSGKAGTPPVGEDGTHSRQLSKSTTAPLTGGMAPIGSRPHPQGQAMNKRTTSPLPSSLSYGFGSGENNERSNSSNSNNNAPKENTGSAALGTWGTGSGVWGSNKIGATSVWG